VRRALEHAGEDCVVSDVGSTKLVLEQARRDPRFVGGHPLAGSHTAGVAHAREDMFEGATWYLCPADDITEGLYERLHDLIVHFGAEPIPVDADMHDRLMATVSQLPHVLANVLVEQLAAASRDDARPPSLRTLGVGPSFRDATRVAGSNTAIWTDIYLANRDALIEAIEQAVNGLEDVRAALTAADAGALVAWNERARAARTQMLGGDTPSADAGLPPADAGPPPSGAGP
jgi:prephenate dehydrogenase